MNLTLDGLAGRRPLGEILLMAGLISCDELAAALEDQRRGPDHERLGQLLARYGIIDQGTLAWALSRQFAIVRSYGTSWRTPGAPGAD